MSFQRAYAAHDSGNELLNFSEIAREFRVSQRTVGRLVSEGLLKTVMPRRRRKIARRDLIRYFGKPADSEK